MIISFGFYNPSLCLAQLHNNDHSPFLHWLLYYKDPVFSVMCGYESKSVCENILMQLSSILEIRHECDKNSRK